MSREAWGDEGDVPERWEDTAIYQDFHAFRNKFLTWRQSHALYFPNDEFSAAVEDLDAAMDKVTAMMEGPI